MTFRQFVIKNVTRNKRLYAAYFLSSTVAVMVFFTFAMFAFHPAFSSGDVNEDALFGMAVAGVIIYVFSFFFVLYSMGAFLQSRKKEFGLLMMQGMSMRQVRFMVFLENIILGIFATVAGILLGTLFAKLILLIAENVLIIEETLYFYFPTYAILLTFGSFIVLFLVISIFVPFILRSKKLIELIKSDKAPKQEPKPSIVLTILSLLLLISSYSIAVTVEGMGVIIAMVPVIIMVIIGTYFFFTQSSVFLIHYLKKRKSVFWNKTNMILLSDLAYRMKDNARTFFMVAIISTVAFSAIGTLIGFKTYITESIKEVSAFSFSYANEDEEKAERDIAFLNDYFETHNIKVESSTETLKYFPNDHEPNQLIASESMYNQYADLLNEKKLNLANNDIIGVDFSEAILGGESETDKFKHQPEQLEKMEDVNFVGVIENKVMPEARTHYIVSDAIYNTLENPKDVEDYTVWQADKGQEDKLVQVGESLSDELPPQYFQANDYMIYTINKTFGSILFIGLFIGIVFFVSAGSFLYFRLFTDLDEDRAKFSVINKFGLTNKELNKVVTQQTAILFFTPILVAIVHGAVALTALSHFFNYSLVKESSLVLGSFFIIQMIYFIIVCIIYIKQVKKGL